MPRISICKKCGIQLTSDEKKFKHSNKTYCEKCYIVIKSESNHYKDLIEFVCKLFDIDKPSGLIVKQIKTYKDEFSYSYAGMKYTLWYSKEILNEKFIPKYGVIAIKNNYEDAREFYENQEESKDKYNKVEIKKRVVTQKIKEPTVNDRVRLINLDNIFLKGGDIR